VRPRMLLPIGLITMACATQPRPSEAPRSEAQVLVDNWVTAINSGRGLEAIDQYMASDYTWHLPGEDIRGRAGVRQFFANEFTRCPRFHMVAEEVIVQQDRVVVRWSTACDPDSPPNGSITIDRFVRGQFAEGWEIGSDKGWLPPSRSVDRRTGS
jgi:predicted SnoaL-like aldol condensation-catalyzing enzyme